MLRRISLNSVSCQQRGVWALSSLSLKRDGSSRAFLITSTGDSHLLPICHQLCPGPPPLLCVYKAFLCFGIAEDVPVAARAPRGSHEAINFIVEQLQHHPTSSALLLANHGLLAFTSDPLMAALSLAQTQSV